jgi:hypothetical protein
MNYEQIRTAQNIINIAKRMNEVRELMVGKTIATIEYNANPKHGESATILLRFTDGKAVELAGIHDDDGFGHCDMDGLIVEVSPVACRWPSKEITDEQLAQAHEELETNRRKRWA